jgi:hypothetical protein
VALVLLELMVEMDILLLQVSLVWLVVLVLLVV